MVTPVDAIIIGFGKAGKTLAGYLAKKGEKVVLIEQDETMYGGTCINRGCIPSKTLVKNAERASLLTKTWSEKERFYREAVQDKMTVVTTLRGKNYGKLASFPNLKIVVGTAAFLGAHEVEVGGASYSSPKIFINTGSTSFVPPLTGIKDNPHVYLSDTLMNLTVLPKTLTIIGGGYIGLEFANMFNLFGSKVTILQVEDSFIPREDRDIAVAIATDFEKRGIQIVYGVSVDSLDPDGTVHYKTKEGSASLPSEAILVATGRKPNIASLHLEKAGVALTSRGAIAVDDHLESNVPGVFAMGDVNGGLQFTYISLDDFRIVKSYLENPSSARKLSERKNVAYSVFISPAFSRVGLSEADAKAKGIEYKLFTLPAGAIPKALVLGNTTGLLKALVDPKTNLILGAHLYCNESYELINLISLAMDYQIPYTALRDKIYTHPTMSEAFNDLFA
jgi:pyruvate/2-oxoglutarate dehydrogenase complex dihydrolipoamide dehydrogenase (E3) component